MKTNMCQKTKTTKLIRLLIPSLLVSVLACGCAQNMALRKPGPFSPTGLKPGVERTAVVAELGEPVSSKEKDSQLIEGYAYVDGGSMNSANGKTSRVVLYTAGDVFTLFLDQLIWMPTELYGFNGTDHSVTIEFAKSDGGVWQIKTVEDKTLQDSSSRKK